MGAIEFSKKLEPKGEYDVIVTDGFSGNIALKSIEGTAKFVMKSLKQTIMSSLRTKIGSLFLKKGLYGLKDKMDYNNKGGALLIGLKKQVIKVHGSAKRDAVKAAVMQASRYAKLDIVSEIEKSISSAKED